MLSRKLQHLPFRDHGGGVGEDVEHPKATRLHHQLEGPGKQVIADQNRRLIVPEDIRRRPPAPLIALVHHVVMEERRGVNELHRRRQPHLMVAVIAPHLRRGEGQDRAQPFAPRLNQVRRQFRNARRMLRLHPLPDRLVHRLKLRRDQGCQAGKGVFAHLGSGASRRAPSRPWRKAAPLVVPWKSF